MITARIKAFSKSGTCPVLILLQLLDDLQLLLLHQQLLGEALLLARQPKNNPTRYATTFGQITFGKEIQNEKGCFMCS
jgi:hypothetical protein